MYKKKRILAVIPARSGSKAIKNKNIKILNRKPLLFHSIKYANQCKFVDKTIVSTDSKFYAKIALKFKAEVPFMRSKKLAGDKIKDFPVIKEALNKCEKIFKIKFDYIVLLRPTSPLREKGLIEKALKIIHKNKNSTSVRSVIKSYKHPYRHWKINKNGIMLSIIKNINEPYNIPRQQLPKYYFQSGDLEIIKRKTILNGSVSGNKVLPIIVNYSNDIDNLKDFKKLKK